MLLSFAAFFLLVPLAEAQSKPIDLALGWNYAHNNEGDGFSNLNGWYGAAVWEFSERTGLAISHESYWGGYAQTGENEHVYLAGLSFKLRKGDPRIAPFLQPFGGATRSSLLHAVQYQPTFELTGGMDIRLRGELALEIIPAEYVLVHAGGGFLNTYQTAVGLAYTFKRR